MSALRRSADAQASLQEQFDKHKCEHEDSHQFVTGVNADALLRDGPKTKKKRKTTEKKKMMMTAAKTRVTRSERRVNDDT
jgi:hypothetical protein